VASSFGGTFDAPCAAHARLEFRASQWPSSHAVGCGFSSLTRLVKMQRKWIRSAGRNYEAGISDGND
jgi:hypothetical protein